MVNSVSCINRYAVPGDIQNPTSPQSPAPGPKPSFTSDCYESSFVPEEKHGSFLGFLAKTVLGAAIIAGGLVAARKYIPALGKDVTFDTTKMTGKAKSYIATAADFVERNVKQAYEWCTKHVKRENNPETPIETSDAPKTENQ